MGHKNKYVLPNFNECFANNNQHLQIDFDTKMGEKRVIGIQNRNLENHDRFSTETYQNLTPEKGQSGAKNGQDPH